MWAIDDTTARNKEWFKSMMQRHGLAPLKRLGQHFLADATILNAIVSAAELSTSDHVIEIGAGFGTLTHKLAEHSANVLAIECDKGLFKVLQQRFEPDAPLQVIHSDGLKYLHSVKAASTPQQVKLVGNIPYHITSPLLLTLYDLGPRCPLAVFLVQHEVAGRLSAEAGTRATGALSVLLQLEHEIEILGYVPRDRFWPQPDVDSQIIRIRLRGDLLIPDKDRSFMRTLVQALFLKRRKTLKNSLKAAATLLGLVADPENILNRAGIDFNRRGESLTLKEIWILADVLRSYQ